MIKPLEEEDLSDTLHTKGFTVDSVKEAPYTTVFAADLALTQENIIFYKVSVYISSDNGKTWIEAGPDTFPQEGVTVLLPYPEGTDGSGYDFTVTHMFAEVSAGHNAGDVEVCSAAETAGGLWFTLHSLSPVAVSWKAVEPSSSDDDQAHEDILLSGGSQGSNSGQRSGDSHQGDNSAPPLDNDLPQTRDSFDPFSASGFKTAVGGIFKKGNQDFMPDSLFCFCNGTLGFGRKKNSWIEAGIEIEYVC